MNKKYLLVVFGFLGLIIISIGIWVSSLLSQQGTERVSLLILPGDAVVKIDSKEYANKESIRLKPGIYTAVISKEGFETDTQKLIVEESKEVTLISMLAPISVEAQRWVKDNQNAYIKAEGKAGELATLKGENLIERYPIIKWLPLQKATYVIGYKQSSSNDSIVITVEASVGYREAALQEIRGKGYDPSDYKIEFNNYRNPF